MEFYFDIKARVNSDKDYSDWLWPPIWSGKIEAKDRKTARNLIDEEYNRSFSMRFSSKNPDEPFLLSIKDMTPHLAKRFEILTCEVCGCDFTLNDKHITNDNLNHNVCSVDCYNEFSAVRRSECVLDYNSNNYLNPPVIYKITNAKTGMCYVGKSIRSFTLRWWEHIKAGKMIGSSGSNHKFYSAINNSKLTDWIYQVIEVIENYPDESFSYMEKEKYITYRESFWINEFDCIKNGYNSVISNKENKKISE